MSPVGRNSLMTALHVIERYALNTHGVVGSLYDAHTDNLLTTLPVKTNSISKTYVTKEPVSELKIIDNSNCINLLKTIDIEDELRVSIVLGIVQITKGILMLNNYELPIDHTILLIHYRHIKEEEHLPDDISIVRNSLPHSLSNDRATHIITSVRKGIEFVILLELTNNEYSNKIDSILKKLCKYFTISEANFLSKEDQQNINHLKPTIFTCIDEIRTLADTKNLSDICQSIHRFIFKYKHNIPLSYTLNSVQRIYYDDPSNQRISYKLDPSFLQNIEQKIVPLCNKFRTLDYLFSVKISPQLSKCLKSLIEETYEKISGVKKLYEEFQQLLAKKVFQFRQGNFEEPLFENELNSESLKLLNCELEALHDTVVKLQNKATFINKLKINYNMEYLNVADFEDTNDDQSTLEGKLICFNQQQNNYYLCSSDELLEKIPNNHETFCMRSLEKYQKNLSLRLVFADFSYCKYKLDIMKILNASNSISKVSSLIESNEMNVLLIGETGVGKSTFINAFVNYLAFHSLDDAKAGEPIVLIPVSFLITIGDQFEDKTIHFGQSDSNENRNNSGQSVTQHCQTYIFNIDNNVKIRIIDTPGIGDTRGIEQDNKNIEHILQYINHLPHLNAICFLLKPNTTRLNGFFRSCFMELFTFLGPNAHDNIVFCFTNTRATFYTPGNTAPVLKNMLKQLHADSVALFSKRNTFCFDSESFRYLAVIKATNEMVFDKNQENDFNESWKFSADESIRLLDFIKNKSKCTVNKFHSIRHAQMMITTLVRPILETIRNALRNLVLQDIDGNKRYVIEMYVHSISKSANLCTTCHCESSTKIDSIWIAINSMHECRILNECATCSCAIDKHLPILYTLECKASETKGTCFYSETQQMKDHLLQASFIFTRFLLHTTHISQNPFLPWFDLFIKEEKELYSEKSSSSLNATLCNSLYAVRKKYVEYLNEIKNDQEEIQLDSVYKCIEEILMHPIISEQMEAIKTSQMKILKDHEHDVSLQHPHMNMNEFLNSQTNNF
ncbi:unnamed protein product [Rotaria sp. Silwood2]|nr:unnamed protein product [Rotaria sp. Silwood2]CAF3017789.1 unnamed protein product [Rotaria sp. Silwood2]CAF3044883.1 unnamed protein product [Rotaria sp. Silwood2]CAF3188336.1 unnamed protein product [Rotaria sp. Silwood2]CAF3970135.1 unnamed protein product [Rotaria sp. Silwood2]